MKLITLFVPEPDLWRIKRLIDAKLYPSRAEFIRLAIKQVLGEEEKHV